MEIHSWCYLALVMAYVSSVTGNTYSYKGNGETPSFWNNLAKEELKRARAVKPNIAVAKNVIVFLGDGMGMSTVTASRILKGQKERKTGEESVLSFENFPHVGLSKTYTQDVQVADSAGTATAFFCGIKTSSGALGVDGRARRYVCNSSEGASVTSILDWSLEAGKSVGIVTTARITHATPGALYAHTPERNWEGDADMVNVTGTCVDIAAQLVDDNPLIQVVLGGGRRAFMPYNDTDPEGDDITSKGRRDGRNLVEDWQDGQKKLGRNFRYVWNDFDFKAVDPQTTDSLFGLFNSDHMQYEVDRANDTGGEPSLEEMTTKAIQILQKNSKGFFLMVEGARIDHGHHDSNAYRSLHDTLAMDKAVAKAITMVDQSESLTIVTADHSHVFTIAGYPSRGNPIFGKVDETEFNLPLDIADDGLPYTTLQYSNGPGFNSPRDNVTTVNTDEKDYLQHTGVPLDSETHGGEDVAIYANGPMSHLFHSVHEQHYIAHVMAYASCVGPYSDPSVCAQQDINEINAAVSAGTDIFVLSFCLAVVLFSE